MGQIPGGFLTLSFSSGVMWFEADFIFSSRALYPEHSAFSSWISDTISSVVRELFSTFSSVITDFTQIYRTSPFKHMQ